MLERIPVKWAILLVLLILVAPSIAKQFSKEEVATTRRGILYRSVARFGTRVVLIAFIIVLVMLAVAAYYVIQYVV